MTAMRPEVEALLRDIEALCERRGWADALQACADARDGAAVVLAFAEGVEPEPFAAWAATAARRPVRTASLAQLLAAPASARAAGRTVAVFSTRALPTAADMEAVHQVLFRLPAAARAAVLIAMPNVVSDADVQAAHKMAWGLFVPSPKAAWSGQPLASRNVFLWDDGDRFQSDAGPLAAFIGAPAPPGAPAAALARVLQLAEAHELPSEAGAVEASAWSPGELRSRFRDRLRVDMGELAAAWRLAIRSAADAAGAALRGGAALDDVATDGMTRLRDRLSQHAQVATAEWTSFVAADLGDAPWAQLGAAADRAAVARALGLQVVAPNDELFDGAAWRDLVVNGTARPSLARSDPAQAALRAAAIGVIAGALVGGLLGGGIAAGWGWGGAFWLPHIGVHLGVASGIGAGVGAAIGMALAADMGAPPAPAKLDTAALQAALSAWVRDAGAASDRRLEQIEADLAGRIAAVFDALKPEGGAAVSEDTAMLRAFRDRLAALR